jgi:hypothetical protein
MDGARYSLLRSEVEIDDRERSRQTEDNPA